MGPGRWHRGQRPGHRPATDAAFRPGGVDEDHLQHAGDADEVDQVGFGDGAAEGLELLADLQVLPVEAQGHAISKARQVAARQRQPLREGICGRCLQCDGGAVTRHIELGVKARGGADKKDVVSKAFVELLKILETMQCKVELLV